MTATISIRVPADLAGSYEALKGTFNTSAVCLKAIELEIEYQEALQAAESEMERTIARLRKESSELHQSVVADAKMRAAKDFHLLKLPEIQEIMMALYHYNAEQNYTLVHVAGSILQIEFEGSIEFTGEQADEDWILAWAESIGELWDSIEERFVKG